MKRNQYASLFAIAAFNACSGAPLSITTSTKVEPGSECPGGGLRVATGADKNGNRILEDDEITTNNLVCGDTSNTPAAAITSVTRTGSIAPGENGCLRGGVKVELGLDNGDGGGVARDGTLQDGEVDKTEFICSATSDPIIGSFEAPSGPAGTATISAQGGNGGSDDTTSGAGGNVEIRMQNPSNGGHVKLFKTGTVPVQIPTFPTAPASNSTTCLIPNGTSDLPAPAASKPVGAIADCWVDLTHRLRINETGVASGLVIPAGATLNFVSDVRITGFVDNRGTIQRSPVNAADPFNFSANQYFGASSSALRTAGPMLIEAGQLVNAGTIATTPASGSPNGSNLTITAGEWLNSGSVEAKGAIEGNGGAIELTSELAYVHTGTVDASGGASNTTAVAAGSGGNIEVRFGSLQLTQSNGLYQSLGGNATSGNAVGGKGGNISLNSGFNGAMMTGSVLCRGGNGVGNGGVNSAGGAGGDVEIRSLIKSLMLGANIDTRGGLGGSNGKGGDGGDVEILQVSTDSAELVLLGYSAIDTRAGLVGSNAAGGNIFLGHSQESTTLTGSVINHVNLLAGSDSAIGMRTGVAGGDFDAERIINTGTLTVDGFKRGKAGQVNLFAKNDISNTGAVSLIGGGECCSSADGGQPGGSFSALSLLGNIRNSGAVTANGALGILGGKGGQIILSGQRVQNTAALTARGGDSNAPNNSGAEGGRIALYSSDGSTTNSGTLSVRGGARVGPPEVPEIGGPGVIVIDGVVQ